MRRLWLLPLLVAACEPQLPGEVFELPGQAEVMDIAWRVSYGRTDAPPTIRWVTGAALNCLGGIGFLGPDGACVGGCTIGGWESSVAWRGERDGTGDEFGYTGLAHELWHNVLDRVGPGDPGHRGPWWGPGQIVRHTEQMIRNRPR